MQAQALGDGHLRLALHAVIGPAAYVLEVDDLPTLVDTLRERDVPFRNEIVTGPGGRQILVEDPSGNVIELFERAG